MIIYDREFPHPVLASFRDDVTPSQFDLLVGTSSDSDNYYLDVRLDYANPTLAQLINDGAATHAIHVECRRNFYRNIFQIESTSGRLTISAGDLVGRVEVCAFVQALRDIAGYRIEGSHTDYGSQSFEVSAGDILAVASTRVFDAYVDYDPLRRISSILTVRRSEDFNEGAMLVATDEERIVATLSKNDYDRYTELKADPGLGPLLANQVVVPALLHALNEMQSSSEDDFELDMRKRWFRSVHRKLQELNIDVRAGDVQLVAAAQALLRLPLRRSLETLIKMNPMEDGE